MIPELTVVILTFNSASTMSACLNSLVNQTNHLFKVLIVDDASTDNTLEIVKNYSDSGNLNISVEQNGSHNISKGRNIGISRSDTQYISFLDSDDVADPKWTEVIMQTFKKHPELALLSGTLVIRGSNIISEAISINDNTIRKFFSKNNMTFCTANSAFNKKLLNIEYFFDEDFYFAEDLEIGSRIQKMYKWKFVPEMIIYQSSRSSLLQYSKQIYKYGMWKIFYGYVSSNYRYVDFVPLLIFFFSLVISLVCGSVVPLFALPIFSFTEAVFVALYNKQNFTTFCYLFPIWLIKNSVWSYSIIVGFAKLLTDSQLRTTFAKKRSK